MSQGAGAAAGGWAGGRLGVLSDLRHGAAGARWKAVHDALVTRLVLRQQTTDEAMGMLVLRFPAVVSLEVKEIRLWVGS